MTHETPPTDPKLLWQNQRKEHSAMSLEEVRVKAHVVQLKARQSLIVSFVVGLLLAVVCLAAAVSFSLTPVRMIAAGIMVLTFVIMYKAYRRMWARYSLSPDAAMRGCLEFYRRELQIQYRSAQLIWRFLVPIIVFAFLMWRPLFRADGMALRVFLSSLLLLILFERRREARKVHQMLSALTDFEKENS